MFISILPTPHELVYTQWYKLAYPSFSYTVPFIVKAYVIYLVSLISIYISIMIIFIRSSDGTS